MPGFLATMKNFFGLKPNQTAMEFGREVLALNYKEKLDFHKMLKEQAGLECDPPAPPAEDAKK